MAEVRPRDLSPSELGFQPQKAVPWLSPPLLAGTALRVVLAELFGAYLDKRELQAVMDSSIYDYSGTEEVWFDYIADVGDGFDATYTMAQLLAQPSLTVERSDGTTITLPRGRVLILGGDQVYPTASAKGYENRFKGPYRAALPISDHQATLYALPGNHDWYDGLTAFVRLFAQRDPIGGWRTRQSRSYFALALPHGWWLYAIDAQFDAYLDEPQLQYFEAAADRLRNGDRIILCAARPMWVVADLVPDAYDTIDYFIRTILGPKRVTVEVMIAGDAHHYARYTHGQQHLITCGGGGAYLTGTANLPSNIQVPPRSSIKRGASQPVPYRLAASYPTATQSKRLGWGVFARLPQRNRGFLALLAVLQTLLLFALLTAHGRWVNLPIAVMTLAVLVGTIAFAMPQPLSHARLKHWLAGVIHAPPHLALGVAGAWVWSHQLLADTPRPLPIVLAVLVYGPIAGLLDSWIIGAYLIAASRFGVNVNELYAGQGIDDYKSLLRLHIAADGSLTIYPIAVDRVSRRWRADPDGAPESPWIVAADPPRPRFAELPIPLPGDHQGPITGRGAWSAG